MIRYLPPKGTALTARSPVRTLSRSPPPPESTRAIVSATPCLRIEPSYRKWNRAQYGAPRPESRSGGDPERHRRRRRRESAPPARKIGPRSTGSSRARRLPADAERDQVRGV